MGRDIAQAGTNWAAWLGGIAALGAVLGLGFYRHPLHDDDHPARAGAAALRPGVVRLDRADAALEGIRTGVPRPTGQGCEVPRSALLYVSGRAYVYLETATDGFVRARARAGRPTAAGIPCRIEGWRAGQPVVVQGAPVLLSQEFMPKPSADSGGDDDD